MRVCCFSCCKANKLCARKGKGCFGKDAAESFESVVKGSGVVPICSSYVATMGASAAIDDYAENTWFSGLVIMDV